MRSSVAVRLHDFFSMAFAMVLACGLCTPVAWADVVSAGDGSEAVVEVEHEPVTDPDESDAPLPEEGDDAAIPAAISSAATRTYVLPAATLSSFSVVNIVSGTVSLAPEVVVDGMMGEGGSAGEQDIPTIYSTYVAQGCVYSFDEEAGAFALVNATNAGLTEEGYLLVPGALTLDGEAHPVTSVAAGALSGTDAILVALSKNVTNVDVAASTGAEDLQAIYVSPDNDIYSSYDGCLYDKPLSSLLLVPEGKLGTVRIPSGVETMDPEVFSHCTSVDTVFADADSAAFQILEDADLYNASEAPIKVVVPDEVAGEKTSSDVFIGSPEDAPEPSNGAEEPRALVSCDIAPDMVDGLTMDLSDPIPSMSVEQDPVILSAVMPLAADGSTIAFSGELATTGTGSSSDARWELVGSTLNIYCKEGATITDSFTETTVPWYGVRNLVSKVTMESTVHADSMAYWFCSMTSLTDISGAFIPEGCRDVRHLLRASAMTEVPASFILPASVKNASGMFESCVNLISLPAGFTLAGADGAGIPDADCAKVFSGCVKLEALPEGFALPNAALSFASAFERCWALTSLPASFNPIPAAATDVSRMLYDLPSLRILPASFDFPMGAIGASSPEFMGLPAERDVVSTYCTSPSDALANWFTANSVAARRTLTTSTTGAAYMQFMVPDGSGWKVWKTVAADERGLVANPGPYEVPGYTFTLWRIEAGCRIPYDFDLPYDGQPYQNVAGEAYTRVYADLVADTAPRSGVLPNGLWTAGPGSSLTDIRTDSGATWNLSADGTLTLRCGADRVVDGASVAGASAPWHDLRYLIKRIVTEPGFQTTSMSWWFYESGKLEDISGLFVPEGCLSANRLLMACASLREIPDSFRLPSSVRDAEALFETCVSLERLPDGFTMAHLTSSESYRYFFNGCVSLESLPEGFAFPESTTNTGLAFNNCWSLSSLPSGFKVPDSVVYADMMFYNCRALRILPESFDFPKTAILGQHPAQFLGLPDTGVATATYYGGASEAVKAYLGTVAVDGFGGFGGIGPNTDASGKSNRTLTTSTTGAAYMQFMVPDTSKDPGDPAYWRVWKTVAADERGLVANPGPYEAPGYRFGYWGISGDRTGANIQYDFSLAQNNQPYQNVAGQVYTRIYARMVADTEPRTGDLPNGKWTSEAKSAIDDVKTDSNAIYSLSDDGTLTISCKPGRVIKGDFGQRAAPWYDLLPLVKKVVFGDDFQTTSLSWWFFDAGNIEDMSEVFVPDGCTSTNRFFATTAITELPTGLTLPASVVDADAMFETCVRLKTLPEGFTFSHLAIERFNYLFNGCVSLEVLPESFAFPEGAKEFACSLNNCRSLASLPSGFKVPASAENVWMMFYNCPSLRILPDSFDFPKQTSAGITVGGANASQFMGLPDSTTPTATYYGGSSQNVKDWFATSAVSGFGGFGGCGEYTVKSNRILTTSTTGAAYMQFMVPDGSGWKVWKTVAADERGLVVNPGFDLVDNYAFSGWFVDSGFSLPYDFSLPYNDQPSTSAVTTVYAKYVGPILDCIVPVSTDLSVDVIKVITEETALSDSVDALRFYTYNSTPVKVSAVETSSGAEALAKVRKLFPKLYQTGARGGAFLDVIVNGGSTIQLPLVNTTGAPAASVNNGTLTSEGLSISKELSATVRLRTVGKPDITTAPGIYDNIASLIWTIEAGA